jgi:hypothetical protein
MKESRRLFVVTGSTMTELEVFRCVVFGKSIRSHYAIFHVGVEEPEKQYVVVRIQFPPSAPAVTVTALRSWCRRSCKLGDLVTLRGRWTTEANNDGNEKCFVVNVITLECCANEELIQVVQVRCWAMSSCQEWQNMYRPLPLRRPQQLDKMKNNPPRTKRTKIAVNSKGGAPQDPQFQHGGGVGKRKQGDCIANFLLHLSLHGSSSSSSSSSDSGPHVNPDHWATATLSRELHAKAVKALNKGSGVIDAAGGSGYVSMALGLAGVQSTVVDPRESVGKLPKRDRKLWNRALRTPPPPPPVQGGVLLCQPVVVPYDSLRAWFAQPPPRDVDTTFRHPDIQSIPVCGQDHDLLVNCSAIVALHPDEATHVIVDMAVQRRVPFVVVPCCVFSRLFPDRLKPNSNLPVTTYQDLIDYLASKHESIRRTTLPFEGANVALWSTFQ